MKLLVCGSRSWVNQDLIADVQMLDERPDKVIAFHDGLSRGTQHTIDEARRRGIPVEIHS